MGRERLAGASSEFDPSGIGAYNSPYQDAVVEATLADLERVAARRQQAAEDEVARQAVSAGAFGSSGYQRALDRSIDPIQEELDRNTPLSSDDPALIEVLVGHVKTVFEQFGGKVGRDD